MTTSNIRQISWIKAAKKDFQDFPESAQAIFASALTIIAQGATPQIAKPLKGFGPGVMELALKHRGDAYRVVYALKIGADVWIVHAFQKKSKTGIKTPKPEIDLIVQRIKTLREMV